ncbi:hypothetical protein [Tsuneonella sp. HG222]
MRRSLVITDETSRHPFRASLPPHVRGGQDASASVFRLWRNALKLSAEDVRGFTTSYVACLVAVAAFIF